MAVKNNAPRIALVVFIVLAVVGIFLLWRQTRIMVQHDMRKTSDATIPIAPPVRASLPRIG